MISVFDFFYQSEGARRGDSSYFVKQLEWYMQKCNPTSINYEKSQDIWESLNFLADVDLFYSRLARCYTLILQICFLEHNGQKIETRHEF